MRPLTAVILLSLITVPVFFWNLTDLGLFNTQESIRVNVAREMQRAGEWVVPLRRGEGYIAKPPMVYWSQMVLAGARGAVGGDGEVGEFELRLSAALWGWAGVMATFFAARRLLRDLPTKHAALDPAFWSGAALAVGVLSSQSARVGEIDVMLMAPVATAIMAMHASWMNMLARGKAHWGWIGLAMLAACVAAAVKGPAGLIVIALGGSVPTLLHGWLSRSAVVLGGKPVSRGVWVFKQFEATHPVLVLGLPLVLMWLWLREARARVGAERFEALVNLEVQDNLRWFDFSGTDRYVESVLIALGVFLVFAAVGGWRVWRDRRVLTPGMWVVACWFGLGLLAFVLTTKGVGRYLTPIWPGMAMLAGVGVWTLASRERYVGRLVAVLVGCVVVQGGVLTWWHAHARTRAWAERSPREFVREVVALEGGVSGGVGTLDFVFDAVDFYADMKVEAWGRHRAARPLEELAARLSESGGAYTLLVVEENSANRNEEGDPAERLERAGLRWREVKVGAVHRRPPGDARVMAWRVWAGER
ncbi:MAG: ArnT family glycosyltransferase [Phycisphaerales bacterium]